MRTFKVKLSSTNWRGGRPDSELGGACNGIVVPLSCYANRTKNMFHQPVNMHMDLELLENSDKSTKQCDQSALLSVFNVYHRP